MTLDETVEWWTGERQGKETQRHYTWAPCHAVSQGLKLCLILGKGGKSFVHCVFLTCWASGTVFCIIMIPIELTE